MASLIRCFALLLLVNTIAQAQDLPCFKRFSDEEADYKTEKVSFSHDDVLISGTLYSPKEEGEYPAMIVMPGGGNNVTALRDVPVYLGKRAAVCGIVTLIYDKRGTGNSEGNYNESDFNDFLDDASSGVRLLSALKYVDKSKIGAVGFSQGARLVANLAVRNQSISFIAGVSGPIYPVGLTRYYAFKNSLENSQIDDSLVTQVLPYWEQHFKLLEAQNTADLVAFDNSIDSASGKLPRNLLPPEYSDIGWMPIYNSMGIDFISELKNLHVPWLSIYGENDRIVSVNESIQNIKEQMRISGNTNYSIRVIPNSNHSLYNEEESKNYPFEAEIIKWILSLNEN